MAGCSSYGREPDAPWELPGGPLPVENDDIDAEMDAVLTRLGVMAPAIEEDFLQTHYFPAADGQVVYNVYAADRLGRRPGAPTGDRRRVVRARRSGSRGAARVDEEGCAGGVRCGGGGG